MAHSISVIICTSPGREENLHYCLAMLAQQSCPPDEVIVVSDGALRSEFTCQPFAQTLNLRHNWRPNDMCVSRSRNRGAALAQGDILVFLDTDIMLNPEALAAYHSHFQIRPGDCVYGYFGYAEAFIARSQWFPERRVNVVDIRFCHYTPETVTPSPYLQHYPHWYALGANLALSKENFQKTGGFNTALVGWGQEDLDFSARLNTHHIPIAFSLDAWGEHQVHPRKGIYYDMHAVTNHLIISAEAQTPLSPIHAHQESFAHLRKSIFGIYRATLEPESLAQQGYSLYEQEIILEIAQFPNSIRHHLPGELVPPPPMTAYACNGHQPLLIV
jgi:hypothetical protein